MPCFMATKLRKGLDCLEWTAFLRPVVYRLSSDILAGPFQGHPPGNWNRFASEDFTRSMPSCSSSIVVMSKFAL